MDLFLEKVNKALVESLSTEDKVEIITDVLNDDADKKEEEKNDPMSTFTEAVSTINTSKPMSAEAKKEFDELNKQVKSGKVPPEVAAKAVQGIVYDDMKTEAYDRDESDFDLVERKSIRDTDGFLTEYSWYMNTNPEENGLPMHVFVYGDSDFYGPDDGDYDWECDTYEEAEEWFDSYGEDEEYLDESLLTESEDYAFLDKISEEIVDDSDIFGE